jgi:hypothetical protein
MRREKHTCSASPVARFLTSTLSTPSASCTTTSQARLPVTIFHAGIAAQPTHATPPALNANHMGAACDSAHSSLKLVQALNRTSAHPNEGM